MAEDNLFVYLDHLIPRLSLRYQRPEEKIEYTKQDLPDILRLSDLTGDHMSSRAKYLRKPDFQRATWAWTPEQCVTLLESIVGEQVVPSIIMWTSPENELDYVLDGGHRISVVLAWLKDDWGQTLEFEDEEQQYRVRLAAEEVRKKISVRIGNINDYQQAEEEFDRAVNEGKAPKLVLSTKVFERAQFYRKLRKGAIHFPILWVPGNYEKAEKSFLNINKTGTKLSEWETKIIENRNSSLARVVMSLANIESAKHYWPGQVPDTTEEKSYQEKVKDIVGKVNDIHSTLFKPPYLSPAKGKRLRQPLLDIPSAEMRPPYLAELFTVVKGGKGQLAEQDELLKADKEAGPKEIINSGVNLVNEFSEAFAHLIGPSPKSLGLVPALYFYTDGGRYVRSLLYGFIYWLIAGDDDEILARKKNFSAHRQAFEKILLERKEDVASGITRKTGSGPEITNQTAKYYQLLLELLIKHNSKVETSEFLKDYSDAINPLIEKRTRTSQTELKSRIFPEKQKSAAWLREIFKTAYKCPICEGILDLNTDFQHDHIKKYADGGISASENDQLTHPFCNNNRDIIEAIKNGQQSLRLPSFAETTIEVAQRERQLSFSDLTGFDLYG